MKAVILAAHADDETIGAGGLIPQLVEKGHEVTIILGSEAVFTRPEDVGMRSDDNLPDFQRACELYGITCVKNLGLTDQRFDTYPISQIIDSVLPHTKDADILISHSQNDLNKDHRIMGEVAKVAGRPKTKPVSILAMEIGGTSAWNARHFQPNLYVDITGTVEKKIGAFKLYKNEQRDYPYPCSPEALRVTAQFRGVESGSNFAEAYQIIRLHGDHLALFS